MAQPKSKLTVGAIDELLDQLASLAVDEKVQTPAFLSRSVQVAETLLDLRWAAVVGVVGGSDDGQQGDRNVLFLAGGDLAAKEFAGLGTGFVQLKIKGGEQPTWLAWVEHSPEMEAVEIVCSGRTWGWLVASKGGNQNFKSLETEVLAGVAETIGEHLVFKMSQRHTRHVEHQIRLDAFKLNAHRSPDFIQSAKLIVNDARWLCQSERVCLLTAGRNGKMKLLAVSSVATLDRESDFRYGMEGLANQAVAADVPLASDRIAGMASSDHSKLETLSNSVRDWQQKTGFEFLFGLPVIDRVSNATTGFLVFEASATIDRPMFAQALRQVEPHVAVAMSNSRQFDSIPMRKMLQWIGARARVSSLVKMLLVIAGIVGMFAAMSIVQRPFSVRTHGELLPRVEQQVSAQIEGKLVAVHVQHGESVREGQLLATIENADLAAELDSVDGEYAKTKQLIESKKILLGQFGHSGDQALMGRLAAEISDLGFQLELLASRRKFLIRKQEKQNVLAPQSGQIITWQTQAKLLGKPVRWGDGLFNVAELDGAWDVVLHVPENRIGYILGESSGRTSQKTELDFVESGGPDELDKKSVTFFLKSDPAKRYEAKIVEVCSGTEMGLEHGKVTRIRCTVPKTLVNRRHGATIVADIDCGQRPLWFVCFGEVYDGLRRRWVW